jgi:hypothetical protein
VLLITKDIVNLIDYVDSFEINELSVIISNLSDRIGPGFEQAPGLEKTEQWAENQTVFHPRCAKALSVPMSRARRFQSAGWPIRRAMGPTRSGTK